MKKQILAAIAMILVVVLAIVWVRTNRSGPEDSTAVPMGTVALAGPDAQPASLANPIEIPYDLESWIEATLWRNGLLETHRDSFLTTNASGRTRLAVDSSGTKPVWTVDLSGLDVSVLGHDTEYGDRGMDDKFEVRLKIDQTRLCRDSDRKVKYGGWSLAGDRSLRCGPDDGQKLVRRWFEERFGRAPGASELSIDRGKVALDISCRGKDAVGALGRLRSVGFSRLRLASCTLSHSEALLLSGISVAKLELIDTRTDVLPFFQAKVTERLLVQGGSVRWLDVPLACPQELPSCDYNQRRPPPGLTMEVRDVPLCGDAATAELIRHNAKVEGLRCQGVPLDMIARRDTLEARWDRLKGDDVSKILQEPNDTIPVDDRPTFPELTETWEMAVGTGFSDECGDNSYPKEYHLDQTFGSKGRIQHSYFENQAIQVSYKGQKIRAGMTREALIALLGRPVVDRDGFLAWTVAGTCSGEPANLRAHFDAQGKLDAWIDHVDPECGGC